MTNFQIDHQYEDAYKNVPARLVRTVVGFSESPEYSRLSSFDRQTPGIVCGALIRYLVRLQGDSMSGQLREEETATIAQCYAAIEDLASDKNIDVVNLVYVDVFDNMHCSDDVREVIVNHLAPAAKAAYQDWLSKP